MKATLFKLFVELLNDAILALFFWSAFVNYQVGKFAWAALALAFAVTHIIRRVQGDK